MFLAGTATASLLSSRYGRKELSVLAGSTRDCYACLGSVEGTNFREVLFLLGLWLMIPWLLSGTCPGWCIAGVGCNNLILHIHAIVWVKDYPGDGDGDLP